MLKFVTGLATTSLKVSENAQVLWKAGAATNAAWRLKWVRLARGCKTCHIASLWSVPYGTCFMDALRTHCLMRREFYQREKKRKLTLKSFSVAASIRHSGAFCGWQQSKFFKNGKNKRKLMKRAYLELFDVPWGDKAIWTTEKCPGEGGVSAS